MRRQGQGGNRRFAAEMAAIRAAVLQTPGETEPALREAAFAVAAGAPTAGALPADAANLVEKVARHAWKVTDGDVERLQAAGWSEDALFELIVATAAGAGLGRLERVLHAFDAAGGRE